MFQELGGVILAQREIWVGDNLEMLGSLDTGSVQMVYMDPPFASNRDYDAILSTTRHAGAERVDGFDDRWLTREGPQSGSGRVGVPAGLAEFLNFLRSTASAEISNYVAMMVPRLQESYRILDSRGALYLHCDPSASHYLKITLDLLFGAENFRNEIIWKRTHAHSSSRRFGPVHDVILYYSRSADYMWNPTFTAYDPSYLEKHYRQSDHGGQFQLITCTAPGDRTGTRAHYEWRGQLPPPGRHWAWRVERMEELDAAGLIVHSANGVPRMKRYVQDGQGVALQDVWTDIRRLDANSEERVGYETQKPAALIERLIRASTAPGDLVVDPFGGSGTSAVVAERLERNWVVSDISLLASSFTLARARQEANDSSILVKGFPDTVESASKLLRQEPQTFGIWGTSMLATLTSRRTFSSDVVVGAGRIRKGNRKIGLLSWVPLAAATEAQDADRTISNSRLPTVGFVLDTGRSTTKLISRVKRDYPSLPISQIDLKSIVSADSRRNGVSVGMEAMWRTAV